MKKIIPQAIIDRVYKKRLSHLEIDVALREAGPSGLVAGMRTDTSFDSYRMGPVFGGSHLSGRKTAQIIASRCS